MHRHTKFGKKINAGTTYNFSIAGSSITSAHHPGLPVTNGFESVRL
jgi:hypothetical protein